MSSRKAFYLLYLKGKEVTCRLFLKGITYKGHFSTVFEKCGHVPLFCEVSPLSIANNTLTQGCREDQIFMEPNREEPNGLKDIWGNLTLV